MTKNNFQIIRTRQFEISLKGLPSSIHKELSKIEPILQDNPYSVAKELRKPLQGRYVVRLLNNRYRLVCRIENHAKKVYLD
ncbi:MAG: hypothetical protein HZC29_04750 [Thaumarchaeota archaeon]|nr:hypothetical protein [Nitrososphaerota archaeon]